MKRRFPVLFLALLLMIPIATAQAADTTDSNVLVRIKLVNESGTGNADARTYELLTVPGEHTELLTGWRVPFASGSVQPASGPVPVTFTYQNVGVTIRLETQILEKDRVKVHGSVEISSVEDRGEQSRAPAPRVGTFQHQFGAVFTSGEPMTVSRAPKLTGGSMSIVVETIVQN